MGIYFIRHGDAGDPDPQKYPDDRLRPLTPEGAQAMNEVGRGLSKFGVGFDAVYDSGYVRARQTAQAIAKACGFDPAGIETAESLEPERSPAEVAEFLKTIRGASRVALVGHEPHLSRAVSHLIGAAHDKAVEFKKGAVCRVDIEPGKVNRGTVTLLVPPSITRE